MSDGGEQLAVVVPLLGSLVERVRPTDLGLSTPCASWTTRDLLNHVVGGATMYAGVFGGGPVEDISGRMPDVIGDAPMEAFSGAAERFGAAASGPGAMDASFDLAFGTMDGASFLRFAAFDLLVHSWDLATTLGEELDVDDELVLEIEAFAHRTLDPWPRDGVNFAEPVEPGGDTDPLQRLVAYTGRRPE
jgi:uncharacterized protein (TIGR03086 family)